MMVCFLSDISSLLNWQRVKTNKMAAFTEYVRSSLDNIKTEECMQRKIILLQTLHDRLKGNSLQEYNIFIEEKKLYYDLMIFLTDSGLVKKSFENELGRDYTETDFIGLPEIAEYSLSCIHILLPFLQYFESEYEIYKSIIKSILILCATHCDHYPWSSKICVNKTKDILSSLLNVTRFKTIELLLQGRKSSENLINSILLAIKPHLMKNNWYKNPSNRFIFKWFLLHIKYPHLSCYLTEVLPPSLIFVDDHLVENKVLGLECLYHIIENLPPSELKLNGKADVVYDALKHLLYIAELPVINILHPCLLKFLSGQERNPKNSSVDFRSTRYDEVYGQLLWNMEHEQKILFRRAYSAYIPEYINAMGIAVCYHMKQTLRTLLEYLLIYDGPEEVSRRNALLSLKVLISVAWPRIPYHWEEIMKNILICIYEVEEEDISIEGMIAIYAIFIFQIYLVHFKQLLCCSFLFCKLTAVCCRIVSSIYFLIC
ncbi:TELO2-interacting protein 2-like isoform X4 [Centruroides sculpturatus]|nr:TELO2-interacting protein 2-like isoform X3 [Centruroides sculpturatus]XP_023237457.1 TELO2-interacting protein 2-like isoform X3 [Centruroides sculpturatus]XP_023237458.1 TELO2-interacting protein 2-like isoform X4 [Centruroides sculpturatus]XP_023237460.1 TELO2-interacting protein 2-like isoform X4 [Centruroides sculpturatus]